MKRILVMRSGAVGDFFLTLPVLAALRDRWPAAEIEILGHPHIACLAVEAGLADKLSRIDDPFWVGLFAQQEDLPLGLVEAIAPRDLVLCFTPDADHVVEQHLRRACRGQVIVHPPLPPEDLATGHATQHLLAALAPFGIQPRPQPARISLSADRERQGAEYLKERGLLLDDTPIVAAHPGSGSRKKCWPWARFEDLVRSLADEFGCAVLVTLGPADEHLQRHVQSLRVPASTVISDLSLMELASVLCHVRCYVGNDSGVTHLAAALGVPTVAVFGPTDPGVWAPVGSHVAVVQGRCACGPCSRSARAECRDQICLSDVAVEEVRSCVLATLAEKRL